MKKVLILLIAGFLLLPFTGCDTGTSPGNPVNPVQPGAPTLDTGSLVLTIADPGVTPDYDDGSDPYAVITGATATGSTFRRQVGIPYGGSENVVIANLIPGTWNVKVKVWDDLYADDNLEDVVALGYEAVVITADEEQEPDLALYTQDGMTALLSDVYTDNSIPETESPDNDVRGALTWGLYALMAYDEEFFLQALSEATSEEWSGLINAIASYGDADSLLAGLVQFLGETDDELGVTYLALLNEALGLEYEAADYGDLFAAMVNEIAGSVVGGYLPLYYDLIPLTVTGLEYGEEISGDGALALTVTSDYSAGEPYTWVLNGTEVGTGASYSLSPSACLDGLNILSVQYECEGLVVLGSENILFHKETTVQRLLISDIKFESTLVRDAAVATKQIYADEVTLMSIVADGNSLNYEGIQYLVNLQSLIIINGGNFNDSDFSAMGGLSNLTTIYFRYNWPSETVQNEIQDITPQTVSFVPQLIP